MVLRNFFLLLLGSSAAAFDLSPVLHPNAHHILSLHLPQHGGFPNLLEVYQRTLLEHPLPTKMATGATLAVAGDAIAQSKVPDEPYDRRRALSFAAFDMCYRALQHSLFPIIVAECHGQYIGRLFASQVVIDPSWSAAMEQTLASQLGIVPFLYYPVFYTLTALVQGLDAEAALQRAQETFLPLMKRNLLFWIPVQFVQFGFVEESWQIPFLSVCGLAWTFILSVFAGAAQKKTVVEEETEQLQALERALFEEIQEVYASNATEYSSSYQVESRL